MKKELCVKLVIYKDYTKMHAQQNIKLDEMFNVIGDIVKLSL